MYDYLIVGAGLFGAVCARELTDSGKTCLVIDRRDNVGGNIYTRNESGIIVHEYGAHIFHTSDRAVWDYVNRFAEFNNYVNSPVARYRDELYNMPFNMNTFSKMWGIATPEEAHRIIDEQIAREGIDEPQNLEEQALRLVGRDVYEKLVKGYTEKQWGRSAKDLPAFIIRRLPLRFTFDNNYFNDRYQGIPIGGYTPMIEKLLDGIDVRLGSDYFELKAGAGADAGAGLGLARRLIFTGPIDAFYDYRLGRLEYRSLRFEKETVSGTDNLQGCAVVNYTEREVPYTRIIEHRHFEFGKRYDTDGEGRPVDLSVPATIITREYPAAFTPEAEPYYTINDERNTSLYAQYKALADAEADVIFGGRLGSYKYYDMDKTVAAALECVRSL